jgi:hypothetical protein
MLRHGHFDDDHREYVPVRSAEESFDLCSILAVLSGVSSDQHARTARGMAAIHRQVS